jgi:HK97 family phage major capsid protein
MAVPAVSPTLEQIVAAVEQTLGPQLSAVNTRVTDVDGKLAAVAQINERMAELAAGATKQKSDLDEAIAEVHDIRDRFKRAVQLNGLENIDAVGGAAYEGGYRFDTKGNIVPITSRGFAEWVRDALFCKVEGYAAWVKSALKRDVQNLSALGTRDTSQLNSDAGTVGGFVVPPEYRPELIKLLTVYGMARKIFRFIPMATEKVTMPALDGETQVYEIGENAAPTETHPTLALFTLQATIYAALTHIPLRLIMQSNPAIVQIVIESLFRAFARNEDKVGFTGNKLTTNPETSQTWAFNGVLYTLTTGNTNSRGNANAVVMSTGKTAINAVDFNDFLAMIDATPTPALEGAEWLMNRTILSLLRAKRDSTGRPIAQVPLVNGYNGEPDSLWDIPIRKIEVMPKSNAAATPSVPFVALCNPIYMALGDQQNTTIAQDTSIGFKEGQLWVRGTEMIGFEATVKDAITVLFTAAA